MGFVLALVCLVGLTSAFEDKTVVQYLVDNSQYSTLAGLVNSSGLVGALSSSGPFTVFAPTNAAFNKIDAATLQGLAANTAQLAGVLKYHVVNEFVLVPMVSQSVVKPTLEGQSLNISASAGSLLINGGSKVDMAPNNDIIVNNGVIQPIDTVLLPPMQASLNIAQILLQDDDRFKDLFLALLLSNLVSVLESGDYTVFAPVDSAFGAYKDTLLDPSSPNAQVIYQEILKYHVVPGGRRASALSNGQQLFTVHGTAVNVTVGAGVRINDANVIDADILATNGVIHAIDKLLIPQDINQIASQG